MDAINSKLTSSKEALMETGRKLFLSDKDKNTVLKGIFGAISGLFLGGFLFLVLRYSFEYTVFEAGITVTVITIMMMLGLAVSTYFRCVTALVFPSFFTGKGHAVILSITFAFLLSHNVVNIKYNIEKVCFTVVCVSELALNETKDIQNHFAKPLNQTAEYLAKQARDIKEIQDEINGKLYSVYNDIMSMKNKIDDGVKQMARSAAEDCSEVFKTAYKKCCSLSFPFGCGKQCDPLKGLQSASCQIILPQNTSLQTIADQISHAFKEVINHFNVNITSNMGVQGKANSSQSVLSIERALKQELASKIDAFKLVVNVIEKILSLSLLMLFIQSHWYVRRYLTIESFDNIYVTRDFKMLDKERKDSQQSGVLPLKKREKEEYIDTGSLRITSMELRRGLLHFVQTAVHFFLCFTVLLFDYTLFFILELLQRHGKVDIQYSGNAQFQLGVQGSGFVANIYRKITQDLNVNHNYTGLLNITDCLPVPSAPAPGNIPVYIALYVMAAMFVVLKEYAVRARRKIAAYFFPDREIVRINYLHKLIRHKRIGFRKFLRQKIKSAQIANRADGDSKVSFASWFSARMPCLAKCLPEKTNTCFCCGFQNGDTNDDILWKCTGNGCSAYYCVDCRELLKDMCPSCLSRVKIEGSF